MKSFFIIAIYSFISFSTDKISGWLFDMSKVDTAYFVQNAFTIIEYSLFSLFVILELQSKRAKKVIILLSIIFFIGLIYNYATSKQPHFDSLTVTIEALLIISYCVYFFFEQINIPRVTFIYASFQFWICSGILIYLASTFFLFMQANALSNQERKGYWIIAILSQIIKNLFFSISFLIKSQQVKSVNKFDNQSIYTEF
jgi:hypothetical protein